MATRLPASERTREEQRDLIEGRLASSDERSALLRLATRLIIEEASEVEVAAALGRGYCEHGAATGYRNGDRTGRLKTAEGPIAYAAPQVADRDVSFRSALRDGSQGRTEALEDLAVELFARGLSMRDLAEVFTDGDGRTLLSRAAVSRCSGSGRIGGWLPGGGRARPRAGAAPMPWCAATRHRRGGPWSGPWRRGPRRPSVDLRGAGRSAGGCRTRRPGLRSWSGAGPEASRATGRLLKMS